MRCGVVAILRVFMVIYSLSKNSEGVDYLTIRTMFYYIVLMYKLPKMNHAKIKMLGI